MGFGVGSKGAGMPEGSAGAGRSRYSWTGAMRPWLLGMAPGASPIIGGINGTGKRDSDAGKIQS